MTFRDEIYPLRFNRLRMADRVLANLHKFTEVVHVRGMPRHTPANLPYAAHFIGGARDSQLVNPMDRLAVRTIIRAWTRNISDRYLKFSAVRLRENNIEPPGLEYPFRSLNAITTEEEAWDGVAKNGTEGGCVYFAYDDITWTSFPLYGENVPPDLTYNEYFSALRAWCDLNVLGLLHYVRMVTARQTLMDNARTNIVLEAAHKWIARAQRRPGTIYYELTQGRLIGEPNP